MSASLLDPSFAGELESLRRRLPSRARSGSLGGRTGPRRGGSAEFLEHRPYEAGDDLRRVDWLAFARTGQPIVKLFRAEEDVVVRLLVDTSASLALGAPPKLLVAKRLAAALGYLALADGERAQILLSESGAVHVHATRRGRGALVSLLRELDGPGAAGAGGTDLARTIEDATRRTARPGVLVVLSDFLDRGDWERAIARARAAGHDLALVQVLAPEELDPPWDGDLALEDAESGDVVDLTLDARALEAYRRRLDALFARLSTTARKVGASYARVTTTEPLLGAVSRLVSRQVT